MIDYVASSEGAVLLLVVAFLSFAVVDDVSSSVELADVVVPQAVVVGVVGSRIASVVDE
jgi:hypothetical protein